MIKLNKFWGALLVVFCALCHSPVFADDWIKVESDNFIVYSDADTQITKIYLEKLERFNYLLSLFYNIKPDERNSEKTNIYFLKSHLDLQYIEPNIEENVGGFVKTCPDNISIFSHYIGDKFLNENDLEHQGSNNSRDLIFHEYSHIFMLRNVGLKYPIWFIEGFAEYYGATRLNNKRALIGMPPTGNLWILELENPLDYGDLIGENNKLITAQRNIFSFYAQSWILTHYLMSSPELIEKTQKYLNARNDGEDGVKAFTRIFGMDMKTLNKTLKKYANNGMNARSYSFNQDLDFHISATKMPPSASKVLLYRASALNCPDEKYKPKLLSQIQNIAKANPDDEFATDSLAIAELMIGDETKSKKYFKKKAINDDSPLYWSYYGQSLLFEAKNSKNLDDNQKAKLINEAKSAFLKSYQSDPLNAPNLYYLSKTYTGNGKPDETIMNAAMEAYDLEPSVTGYAINAAIIYIKANEYKEAKQILLSLFNNPHLKANKEEIDKIIAAIDNNRPTEEIIKLLTN